MQELLACFEQLMMTIKNGHPNSITRAHLEEIACRDAAELASQRWSLNDAMANSWRSWCMTAWNLPADDAEVPCDYYLHELMVTKNSLMMNIAGGFHRHMIDSFNTLVATTNQQYAELRSRLEVPADSTPQQIKIVEPPNLANLSEFPVLAKSLKKINNKPIQLAKGSVRPARSVQFTEPVVNETVIASEPVKFAETIIVMSDPVIAGNVLFTAVEVPLAPEVSPAHDFEVKIVEEPVVIAQPIVVVQSTIDCKKTVEQPPVAALAKRESSDAVDAGKSRVKRSKKSPQPTTPVTVIAQDNIIVAPKLTTQRRENHDLKKGEIMAYLARATLDCHMDDKIDLFVICTELPKKIVDALNAGFDFDDLIRRRVTPREFAAAITVS